MKRDIDKISAAETAALLNLDVSGPDRTVSGASPFPPDAPDCLSFFGRDGGAPDALPSGTVVIAREAARDALLAAGATVIVSSNPKYDFCRLFALRRPETEWVVHPSAVIGRKVELAERVAIGPGTLLDGEIRVGVGTRIGANVVLRNRITIGENVTLRNGGVIGEDAFSFGFSETDHAKADAIRFPCFGGVVISDRVEIGNNCVISRGTFRDTILGEGARINDLAHIGNEVRIGARSTITAHTDISARVVIGEGVWVGQSAAVRQGLAIGDRATVGMGAVVIRDVAADSMVMGVPARAVSKD